MAQPQATPITELKTILEETDRLFRGWRCDESARCCRFSLTREEPELWPIEWRLLNTALRALPPSKQARSSGDCPALDSRTLRCRAYAVRPFGCRTHFCGNAIPLGKNPRVEIRALARWLADLAAREDRQATLHPLLTWFRETWL